MRILHIIASVDPESGGTAESLKTSAKVLSDMGHEIAIVSLDDPASDFVSDFPVLVYAQGPSPKKYGYNPRLARWIEKNATQYDVAAIHGLWNHSSIGGWQGLNKAGLPYVVFTHGMMDPWFRDAYPLKHWAKQIFWLLWQGKVLRDASNVLFTCEEERKLARGVFWGYSYKEKVVAFGTSEPPARTEEQTTAFQAAVPQLKGRRYLLFLSRIHEKKGCDLLVEAFSQVASRDPELDVVIAGPDQSGLVQNLKSIAHNAGIAERIHWPGMLEGDAKWGAFSGAEAFILPSHQENFGIVVAEAMACGTPVLTTDKVNIWREVEASGGGLIEPDTQEGISRLLDRWFALSIDDRREMRISARGGFERYFHIDAAARDLANVLSAIVVRNVA